jgi:hypothetical protein
MKFALNTPEPEISFLRFYRKKPSTLDDMLIHMSNIYVAIRHCGHFEQ